MLLGRRRPPTSRVGDPNKTRVRIRSSLTAAGQKVNARDSDNLRRLIQPWQARSFGYYDALGEIKYAAQFYARGLAPLRLYVGKKNAQGEYEEVTEGPEAEALSRIRDNGGGQSQILAAYGRLRFLVGEATLLVTQDDETEQELWEIVSNDELRMQGGTILRYRAPSLAAEEYQDAPDDDYEPLPNGAVVYRLWNPHPRFSMLADCTMQGVLDDCEELVLLTQAVRARVKSRLSGAGLLAIDDRLIPVNPEPGVDEDPDADVFMQTLTEAMIAPITDEGAPSAVVPILLRMTVPDGVTIKDMIAHIPISDPTQMYPETGLRAEQVERIAIGLDMPKEILLGMSDANHWSAWQISEETWRGHLQPIAQEFVDNLTAAYFHPQLRQSGQSDWADYRIMFDATAVINHPDRGKDAQDLYNSGELSGEALREAKGFDEADAPSDEERNEYLGIKLRDSSLAVYGIPSLRPNSILEPDGGMLEAPPAPGEPPTAAPNEVVKGPPAPEQPGEEPSPALVGAVLGANGHGSARLLGACDLAVLRAREAAGARLRSLARNDRDAAALIGDVRNPQVAATLGVARVRAFGEDPQALARLATPLVLDALRLYGIEGEPATRIAATLEQHVARTLFAENPAPLPSPLQNYIAGLTVPVPA